MTAPTQNRLPDYLTRAAVRCTRDLSGTFYEACDCEVLCPCWVGQAPDQNVCNGLFAWQVDEGQLSIDGQSLDAAGLKIASASHHEGERGPYGHQRVAIFVDDSELSEQLTDAALTGIVKTFLGLAGGPLQGLEDLLGVPVNVPDQQTDIRGAVARTIELGSSGATGGSRVVVHRAGQVADIVAEIDKPLAGEGGGHIVINPSALSRSLGPGTVSRTTRLAIFASELVPGSYLDLDLHGRSATFGKFRYDEW